MSVSPPHSQPMTDDALSEQIAKIDHLLGREEHDAGYSAFVYMRKIWPELRSYASLRSQVSELSLALREIDAIISDWERIMCLPGAKEVKTIWNIAIKALSVNSQDRGSK